VGDGIPIIISVTITEVLAVPHGEYGSAGDVFVVVLLFFVAGDYGSAELTASNSTNQVTINSGQTESDLVTIVSHMQPYRRI